MELVGEEGRYIFQAHRKSTATQPQCMVQQGMWADSAECQEEAKKWSLPTFSASLGRDIGAKLIYFLGKVKQEEMG